MVGLLDQLAKISRDDSVADVAIELLSALVEVVCRAPLGFVLIAELDVAAGFGHRLAISQENQTTTPDCMAARWRALIEGSNGRRIALSRNRAVVRSG